MKEIRGHKDRSYYQNVICDFEHLEKKFLCGNIKA